jgi:prevent-host-death family protein
MRKRGKNRNRKYRTLRLAEVRESLGDVVNLVAYAGERIVLTRYGRPVVVVVPLEDVQLLDSLKASERKIALVNLSKKVVGGRNRLNSKVKDQV